MSEKRAACLVAVLAATFLAGAAVLPSSGIRWYGEAAVLQQIAQDDSILCSKPGLANAADPQSSERLGEVANLRQRRERLGEVANLRQRRERLLLTYSLF